MHFGAGVLADQHEAALPVPHQGVCRASVLLNGHVTETTADVCLAKLLYHQTL